MLALSPPPLFAPPLPVAQVASDTPPAVAVNARGQTLVAWTQDGRVVVRRGDAAAARTVSGRFVDEPLVALGADGTAAALWARFRSGGRRVVEAAVAPPGGPFGKPVRLEGWALGLETWALVASGGRFAALWSRGSARPAIHYAVSSGARFGRRRALAVASPFTEVSAAARSGGGVVAAWFKPPARGQAAVLAAGAARFTRPHELSSRVASSPGAFSGAFGYQVARGRVWRLHDSRGADAGSVLRRDNRVLAGPLLAGPVAAWEWMQTRTGEDETLVNGQVDVAVRRPDGAYEPPVRLTAPGELPDLDFPMVAAATPSIAVVAWPENGVLRYATGPPFGTVRTLATGAQRGLSLAAAGDHVVAGWSAGGSIWLAQLG